MRVDLFIFFAFLFLFFTWSLEDVWVDFFRDLICKVTPLKTGEGEETLELYCENVDKIQRVTVSGILGEAGCGRSFSKTEIV